MSNRLRFFCPGCDVLLNVPREHAGVKVACGECGQEVVAPLPVGPATPARRARGHGPARATLKSDTSDVEFARWRCWAAALR